MRHRPFWFHFVHSEDGDFQARYLAILSWLDFVEICNENQKQCLVPVQDVIGERISNDQVTKY